MNKKILIGIGAFTCMVLLTGGAFMALRLLNASGQNNAIGAEKFFKVEYTPAPELPTYTADLSGLVLSVRDNSIFVAQVSLNGISVRRLLQQPTPAGPSTEVVVSRDTKIYRDATYDSVAAPSGGSPGSAVQQVQQTLDLVDISAITSPSYVQVWGQRRGDRINADIIVVLGPVVTNSAGGQ